MSVTVDRATNGWIVYADAEPLVFVTFEGLIDFLHRHFAIESRRILDDLSDESQRLGLYEESYFEHACGTCGANVESD